MSLTAALRTAQNSLLNTARQTVVTSRNISEASNPDYVRRDAVLVSSNNGARVVSIRRNTDDVLLRDALKALSDAKAQTVISDGTDRLSRLINGVDNATSPSTLIASFQDALQTYSADPSNTLLGSSAVTYAKELANGLNSASLAIQDYRVDLDQDIQGSVDQLNHLLSDFKQANDDVIQGTIGGTDVNDALDQRDSLLRQISQFVSVTVVQRENNDYTLYTGQGVTLFETVPRNVSFDTMTAYSPGVTGNPIRIDGVPVIGGDGANTNSTGTLAALVQMRDDVTVQLQGQLDEIARGLVTAFAEFDATGGGGPDLAGLFTYDGGPAIPASGTLYDGIALTLQINPAYDPDVGGNPELLRDGGANGADYVSNATGGTAYSERLINYIEGMNTAIPTDGAAGIAGTYSVSDYAESSYGWLESLRKTSSDAAESKTALNQRLESAYTSKTGVNIDEEMAILIDLEQSYQASARIVATVDQMLQSLLDAVG